MDLRNIGWRSHANYGTLLDGRALQPLIDKLTNHGVFSVFFWGSTVQPMILVDQLPYIWWTHPPRFLLDDGAPAPARMVGHLDGKRYLRPG